MMTIKFFLILHPTLPTWTVSKPEFLSRIQHLVNVLELTCLASNVNDFENYGFRVARAYNDKVVHDVEMGTKSWLTLGKPIDAMSWSYAKEVTKPNPKPNNQQTKANPTNRVQKICTTWNSFRKEGICHYEFSNPGESCVYLHHCSKCKAKGLSKRHKEFQCTESENTASASAAPSSSVTPVTSA